MPDEDKESWEPGHKPSARDALLLLVASAFCAGLFYLWLGEVGAALGYGALTGCALAAIGVEFLKFSRSYRAEHPTANLGAAMQSLIGQSFATGFVTTFRKIMIEMLKLVGIKLLVSVVVAATAIFIAARNGLI